MTAAASSDLNKTWTYPDDEETEDTNCNLNDECYVSHHQAVSTTIQLDSKCGNSKVTLNTTKVITLPKKPFASNINRTVNISSNSSSNSEESALAPPSTGSNIKLANATFQKSSAYTSLPVILNTTNSTNFARISNEIKNFMVRYCVNDDCYESLFDVNIEDIEFE